MLKTNIIIFNGLSLVVTLGLSAILFPYASITDEKSKAADLSMPIEDFADINLGPDYGDVPVADLMVYYMENPPVIDSGNTSTPEKQHFGGC